MIPDFKTYIGESVWGEMRHRSSGMKIRKEDDLDPEEVKQLVNCIEWFATRVVWNKDYEATLDDLCTYIKDFFTKGSKIRVDIPKFINNVKVKWDSFYKGLVNEFINKEKADYMKGTIKESTWGDMRKKSSGEQIRKEDDINLLDETGLVNYMEKVYMSPNGDLQIIADRLNFGTIMISLFEINGKYYNIIYQKISTSNPEITFPVCPDSNIEDLLRELYKVTRLKQYNDKIYKIEPNDGNKITNKFFIEVLDFILKEAEGKYTTLLKKI